MKNLLLHSGILPSCYLHFYVKESSPVEPKISDVYVSGDSTTNGYQQKTPE